MANLRIDLIINKVSEASVKAALDDLRQKTQQAGTQATSGGGALSDAVKPSRKSSVSDMLGFDPSAVLEEERAVANKLSNLASFRNNWATRPRHSPISPKELAQALIPPGTDSEVANRMQSTLVYALSRWGTQVGGLPMAAGLPVARFLSTLASAPVLAAMGTVAAGYVAYKDYSVLQDAKRTAGIQTALRGGVGFEPGMTDAGNVPARGSLSELLGLPGHLLPGHRQAAGFEAAQAFSDLTATRLPVGADDPEKATPLFRKAANHFAEIASLSGRKPDDVAKSFSEMMSGLDEYQQSKVLPQLIESERNAFLPGADPQETFQGRQDVLGQISRERMKNRIRPQLRALNTIRSGYQTRLAEYNMQTKQEGYLSSLAGDTDILESQIAPTTDPKKRAGLISKLTDNQELIELTKLGDNQQKLRLAWSNAENLHKQYKTDYQRALDSFTKSEVARTGENPAVIKDRFDSQSSTKGLRDTMDKSELAEKAAEVEFNAFASSAGERRNRVKDLTLKIKTAQSEKDALYASAVGIEREGLATTESLTGIQTRAGLPGVGELSKRAASVRSFGEQIAGINRQKSLLLPGQDVERASFESRARSLGVAQQGDAVSQLYEMGDWKFSIAAQARSARNARRQTERGGRRAALMQENDEMAATHLGDKGFNDPDFAQVRNQAKGSNELTGGSAAERMMAAANVFMEAANKINGGFNRGAAPGGGGGRRRGPLPEME